MNRFTLSQMVKLPRLADIIMPSYREFHPGRMVTKIGLYEAVLIDAGDIQVVDHVSGDVEPHIGVSKDVEAFHKFLRFTDSIMLPCPDCGRDQAFTPKPYFNPRHAKIEDAVPIIQKVRLPINHYDIYAPVDDDGHEGRTSVFHLEKPKYHLYKENLADYIAENFKKIDFDVYRAECARVCIDVLVEKAGEIRRDFFCAYDNQHRTVVDFVLYEAVDRYTCPSILQRFEERRTTNSNAEMTKEEKKAAEDYRRLQNCVILEKVGQYPSIADLQMFDIEKYRGVLSKDQFRDFKMAIGLYASGVGCGSFVYLRRVFEGLVEEEHQSCVGHNGWSEEEYVQKRFNEKIDYIEAHGVKIIPNELSRVKTKLYGVLSQGIHASSDQECNELFEAVKFAIEEILDHKMARKIREEKLKRIQAVLQ